MLKLKEVAAGLEKRVWRGVGKKAWKTMGSLCMGKRDGLLD